MSKNLILLIVVLVMLMSCSIHKEIFVEDIYEYTLTIPSSHHHELAQDGLMRCSYVKSIDFYCIDTVRYSYYR